MAKNTFILSDLSINCYGFILLTSGIDLSAFTKNPVMLYDHDKSDVDKVIGKWNDIRVEGTLLKAEPEFDVDAEFAKKVSDKVSKGYLNAASVGFSFDAEDVRFDVPGYEGIPVIVKSVLKEASITPIGGNQNAVKLYNNGELITSTSLSVAMLNDQQININQKQNDMKKILGYLILSGIALTETASEEAVLEVVKKFDADKKSAEGKLALVEKELSDLKKKISDEAEADSLKMVEDAFKAGKIDAQQKASLSELAKVDPKNTKAIIDSMKPHTSITKKLNDKVDDGEEETDKYAKLSFREMQKNHSAVLNDWRKNDPERYKAKYLETYPNAKFNG